jgi:molecular chaperone DnaK
LKRALSGDDKDVIETKANALSQASASLAQQAYAQAGGAAGAEGAGANASNQKSSGDDVLDAEFEEVKDKNKGA